MLLGTSIVLDATTLILIIICLFSLVIKHLFDLSMEGSSMVCIAAFGPGDPGSNPGWFGVSNSK